MPINMNLMRPNNTHAMNNFSGLNFPQNRFIQNSSPFQVARPAMRQMKGNMFHAGIISNVVHSKSGCSSCGK
uniref:Uncharacterized protein n=1 Tax=viral metagenome TaxID=1070528 RepID=A0A6C0AZX6_9ZZZZ